MSRSALDTIDPEGARLIEESIGAWQRRRAFQYCLVAAAFFLLSGVQLLVDMAGQEAATFSNWIDLAVSCLFGGGYVAAGLRFRRMPPQPERVARFFGWIMVVAGGAGIIAAFMVLTYDAELSQESMAGWQRAFSAAGTALVVVFLVHFVGALFVALPPKAALWPLLPLWTLYAGGVLQLEGPIWFRALLAGAFPLAGGPGLVWSVWRHDRTMQRLTVKVLGGRYGEIRRDLSEARRVHEAIFPAPIEEGPLRLRYAYEPMRDVGGDFVFARRVGEDALLCVLVDVTGHGVASALAVTRIHAALALLAAGEPPSAPGELIRRINSFVHAELAQQGIYATAIAVFADAERGRLVWCSAGHPPGLLRRLAGSGDQSLVELGATCPMLGVLPASEFDAQAEEVEFRQGDLLVLYTDGLIEAMDAATQPFGVERLRRIVAGRKDPQGMGFTETLMQAMRRFRAGAVADDTLVVELVFVAGPSADTGGGDPPLYTGRP